MSTERRLPPAEWLWFPLVAAALLLIYLPGLGNSLVYDDSYLTEGLFAEYASAFQLRARWLSYGSFVWVQAIFGEGWWKQRLFNLLLHVSVVVAIWALYRELLRHVIATSDEPPAPAPAPLYRSPALGLAVGFFALNPVAVYAVAYLIQRSIVMATLFTVIALWLFARGLREKKGYMHVLALASYAAAVLSKEHAILAPLAAIPVYILVARPSAKRLGAVAAAVSLLVAVSAALLYQRYGEILGKAFDEYSHLYLEQLSKLEPAARANAYPLSILNEAWLFFRYGIDWMLPYSGWMSISLRPPFPIHFASFPQILGIVGYVGVVAGGFALLLRYRDGRALLGLSLLLPALLFATEFSTVWVQDPFVLYRSYLWAIGVPGLVFFAVHGPPARVLLGIGLVAGALLVWQSWDRVASLSNPETSWTDAIKKLPNDPRAVGRWFPYLNRGSAYAEQNLFALALRDFEASGALGDQGMGMINMGSILSAQGKHREALEALDRAAKEGYSQYNLPFQRGLALFALGRVEEGYRQMQATIDKAPPSPTRELALLQLGRSAMQLGHRDEAAKVLELLLATEPRNNEARYLLGMTYVMKGEPKRAREVLDALIKEQPGARAYYARALANYALRLKAEATADIDNAARLGGDSAHLKEWQAKIRALP